MDYQDRQAQAMLGKHMTYHKESCPLATQDVHENTKNRDWTIDNFGYGPMNPDYPNEEFWEKKAEIFNTDVCEAMSARCGNCGAFDQTWKVMCCIGGGIGTEEEPYVDPRRVITHGNLGYCQLFKFKCAGDRTCDAWIHGGPITDEMCPPKHEYNKEGIDVTSEMDDIIGQLHGASDKHKKQAHRLTSLKEQM